MGTQENGIASNVARPAAVNIVSSTNANPIVITTATDHKLTTGDTVDVEGHLVNTSANGVWTATVTGVNTFSIPVAGVGVGGATGTAHSLGFNSTFTIPADGVDIDASATYNVPFEALADRTAYLMARVGPFTLIDTPSTYGGAQWSINEFATNVSNAGWTDFHAAGCPQLAGNYVLKLGDLIMVVCQTSVKAKLAVQVAYQVDFSIGGGPVVISGSDLMELETPATDVYYPVTLVGYYTAQTADVGKLWTACVAATANGVGPFTLSMGGIINLQGFHYRSTS